MKNLREIIKELDQSPSFIREDQFYTSVAQNWSNQGVTRGDFTTRLMSGREIVSVTNYIQHDRIIYTLESNLLGESFLYNVNMRETPRLESFELRGAK